MPSDDGTELVPAADGLFVFAVHSTGGPRKVLRLLPGQKGMRLGQDSEGADGVGVVFIATLDAGKFGLGFPGEDYLNLTTSSA